MISAVCALWTWAVAGDALAKIRATAAPMKPKKGADAGQSSDDMLPLSAVLSQSFVDGAEVGAEWA